MLHCTYFTSLVIFSFNIFFLRNQEKIMAVASALI